MGALEEDAYHAIHGYDIASFEASGTQRPPTVSALHALDELSKSSASCISTGLSELDQVLAGPSQSVDEADTLQSGLKRGQVTEIWGPPGSGKTAIGIQLSSNALLKGDSVSWVDCSQSVSQARLGRVIRAVRNHKPSDDSQTVNPTSALAGVSHYACLTLPHLLALCSRWQATSTPWQTSLIVISNLSALINSALPKSTDVKQPPAAVNKGPGPTNKRLQGLQSIITSCQKLAATRNCAVVLLSQCATKVQSENNATLIPAINAAVWEQGISTRLVVFRDWTWAGNDPESISLVGLQKLDGRAMRESVEHVTAFTVEEFGLSSATYKPRVFFGHASPTLKRKLGHAGLDLRNPEDEEYGWAAEDALPSLPPQWQGSEDLLLGNEAGHSDEEGDDALEAQDEDESRAVQEPA